MSDGQGERFTARPDGGWRYVTGRNVIERHLGRMLRAMYDALPVRPPSRVLEAALRSLDTEAGSADPRSASNRQ